MKLQVTLIAVISVAATALAIILFTDADPTGNDRAGSGSNRAGGSISALTAAVTADPENVILLKRLARAQRQAGNRQSAIESYLAVSRIAPDDIESNNALRALAGQ